MKIILHAYTLVSPPMNWPEGTSPVIKIQMFQPRISIGDFYGKEIASLPPRLDLCEFEWSGNYEQLKNSETAKSYYLRSIG
jgi:hypothetical protein